jgi:hypothetical protein
MRPNIELIALFVLFGATVWYSFDFVKNGFLDIVEGYKIKNKVLVVKGVGKVVVIPLFFVLIWALGVLFTKMCFFCQ